MIRRRKIFISTLLGSFVFYFAYRTAISVGKGHHLLPADYSRASFLSLAVNLAKEENLLPEDQEPLRFLLQQRFLILEKRLAKIYRYSRNPVALQESLQAYSDLKAIEAIFFGRRGSFFNETGGNEFIFNVGAAVDLRRRNADGSRDVCPERWLGISHGYPLFERSYAKENCSNELPLVDLLSIIILADSSPGIPTGAQIRTGGIPTAGIPTAAQTRTGGIPTPGIPTGGIPTAGIPTAGIPTAGIPTGGIPTPGVADPVIEAIASHLPNIAVFIRSNQSNEKTKAKCISCKYFESSTKFHSIVQQIKTKYVLVLKDLTQFKQINSSVIRLLQAIYYYGFDVAGGSFRNSDGLWHRACYQMGLKNYCRSRKISTGA